MGNNASVCSGKIDSAGSLFLLQLKILIVWLFEQFILKELNDAAVSDSLCVSSRACHGRRGWLEVELRVLVKQTFFLLRLSFDILPPSPLQSTAAACMTCATLNTTLIPTVSLVNLLTSSCTIMGKILKLALPFKLIITSIFYSFSFMTIHNTVFSFS